MPICRMCDVDKPTWQDVCVECANDVGLPAPVPPLRKPIPCERCHGRSFVRCVTVRERGAYRRNRDDEPTREYFMPLAATFALHREPGFAAPNMHAPIGVFEAYICRACGFTEWYARDAGSIPIGREFGTEVFEAEDRPPFR
jgi:hypothetical protein